MASTCSTYGFGAVTSIKSLATENMGRMTVSIFAHRRQLEALNFEMTQHVNKRISDVSINALQNGTKPAAIAPSDFSET